MEKMMMHKSRHSRLFKAIATGLVCLFLVNTTLQQTSYAYAPSPKFSTLATNTLGDSTITRKDYDDLKTFLTEAVVEGIMDMYVGNEAAQEAAAKAWLAQHKAKAKTVLVDDVRKTAYGFVFTLVKDFTDAGLPGEIPIGVSEFAAPARFALKGAVSHENLGSGVVMVQEGMFQAQDEAGNVRTAEVRAVTIDPRITPFQFYIHPDATSFDFDEYAVPPVAKKRGKKPKDLSGVFIQNFVGYPPAEVSGQIEFATGGDQFQFNCPNTLYIVDGKPVTMRNPGIHQKREHFEAHKGIDGSLKLDGTFHVFVLDAGKVGVREIEFDDGQAISGRIDDIRRGVAGPAVVLDEVDVVDEIQFTGDRPTLNGNQVVWDPETRLSSFCAIGDDPDGNVVHLTVSDLQLKAEPSRGIYLRDLPELAKKRRLKNLILLGGSFDAVQHVAGAEAVPGLKMESTIVSSGGLSPTGEKSDTQKYYEKEGRPLAAVWYTATGVQTEPDRVLAEATEPVMQQYYGQHSPILRDHVAGVTNTALTLAREMPSEMGITEEDHVLLAWAALLHDCGSIPLEIADKWVALGKDYGIFRPMEDFQDNRDTFQEKYACARLTELLGQHGNDMNNVPESEIIENAYIIVAQTLVRLTGGNTQELGVLCSGEGSVEENVIQNLRGAFLHAEVGADMLDSTGPGTLTGLGLTPGLLEKILPIIQYHTFPSQMSANVPENIRRLTYILCAADSIDATNRRAAGREWYGREVETIKDTFSWLDGKRERGDISPEVYAGVEDLILNQNPQIVSLICQARELDQTDVLPDYDREYVFQRNIHRRIEREMNLPSLEYFHDVGEVNVGVVFATGPWELDGLQKRQVMKAKVAQLIRLCDANPKATFTIYVVDDARDESEILVEVQKQFDEIAEERSNIVGDGKRIQLDTHRLQDDIEQKANLSETQRRVLDSMASADDSRKWGSIRLGMARALEDKKDGVPNYIVITDADNTFDLTQIPLQLRPMVEDQAVGAVATARFIPEAISNCQAFGHVMEDEYFLPWAYHILGVPQLTGVDIEGGHKAYRVTDTFAESVLGMTAATGNGFIGDTELLLMLALNGQGIETVPASMTVDDLEKTSISREVKEYRDGFLKPILEARNAHADLYAQNNLAMPPVTTADIDAAFTTNDTLLGLEEDLTKEQVEARRDERERMLRESLQVPPAVSCEVGMGVDGKLYRRAPTSRRRKANSDKRLGRLISAIEHRVGTVRHGHAAVEYDAVDEVRWLLEQITDESNEAYCLNCTDRMFRLNMPPHMRAMAGLVDELDEHASPALLIAAMLHDCDRFYDGYYVRMKEEPGSQTETYKRYYKPIQHPAMAADMARRLLTALRVDDEIIESVDALIRHHEAGVPDRVLAAAGIDTSEIKTLRTVDVLSVFYDPVLFINSYRDYAGRGQAEGFEARVGLWYKPADTVTRDVIDRAMAEKAAEFEAAGTDGQAAYAVFAKVQKEVQAGKTGQTSATRIRGEALGRPVGVSLTNAEELVLNELQEDLCVRHSDAEGLGLGARGAFGTGAMWERLPLGLRTRIHLNHRLAQAIAGASSGEKDTVRKYADSEVEHEYVEARFSRLVRMLTRRRADVNPKIKALLKSIKPRAPDGLGAALREIFAIYRQWLLYYDANTDIISFLKSHPDLDSVTGIDDWSPLAELFEKLNNATTQQERIGLIKSYVLNPEIYDASYNYGALGHQNTSFLVALIDALDDAQQFYAPVPSVDISRDSETVRGIRADTPEAAARRRELAKGAYAVIASGGGGRRYDVSLPEGLKALLEKEGVKSKPTGLVGVSGACPTVRTLEALSRVCEDTGVDIPVFLSVTAETGLDSLDTEENVLNALRQSDSITLRNLYIVKQGTTDVRDYETDEQVTTIDPATGQPIPCRVANGTLGVLLALEEEMYRWNPESKGREEVEGTPIALVRRIKKERNLKDMSCTVLYGDEPVLNDEDGIYGIWAAGAEGEGADVMPVGCKKTGLEDPPGGTICLREGRPDVVEKPDRAKWGLHGLEMRHGEREGRYYTFNTGSMYLSGKAVELTLQLKDEFSRHYTDKKTVYVWQRDPVSNEPVVKAVTARYKEGFLPDVVKKIGRHRGMKTKVAEVNIRDYCATKDFPAAKKAEHRIYERDGELLRSLGVEVGKETFVDVSPMFRGSIGKGVKISGNIGVAFERNRIIARPLVEKTDRILCEDKATADKLYGQLGKVLGLQLPSVIDSVTRIDDTTIEIKFRYPEGEGVVVAQAPAGESVDIPDGLALDEGILSGGKGTAGAPIVVAKAKPSTGKKDKAAFFKGAAPTQAKERVLNGSIRLENGEITVTGATDGSVVEQFADYLAGRINRPQLRHFRRLLEKRATIKEGVTIRIARGSRDAADTTPGGQVVHISEFLARQFLKEEGIKPPLAVLDKLAIRNERVHASIQRHLPPARTREEALQQAFAIEVFAAVEEITGALELTRWEKRSIYRWVRRLNLSEEAARSVDDFFELADLFESPNDIYTRAGLTAVAVYIANNYTGFEQFAEIRERKTLPRTVTAALGRILPQVGENLPASIREKLEHAIQINAPPADMATVARGKWNPQDTRVEDLTDTNVDEETRQGMNETLVGNTTSTNELLQVREAAATVRTGERFGFPDAMPVDDIPEESVRENVKTTATMFFAGGLGSRLIGKLKRIRGIRNRGALMALADEWHVPEKNRQAFEDYWQYLLGMSEEQFALVTKPTVPLAGGKSPMQINLERTAAMCKKYGVDMPIVIVASEATRPAIKQMLEENDNFGLKNIVMVIQDENPIVDHEGGRFLVNNGEVVTSPDGTGGVLDALAETAEIINSEVETEPGLTGMDWLERCGSENINVLSGDMLTPTDYMEALIGADRDADGVSLSYEYPPIMDPDTGIHKFKLGTHIEVTDPVTGRTRVENIEYGERPYHEGLAEAIAAHERAGGIVSANPGAYRFGLQFVKRNIGTFREHLQRNKDEESAPIDREADRYLKVDKFEKFLPDYLRRCRKLVLIRSDSSRTVPLKDPTIVVAESMKLGVGTDGQVYEESPIVATEEQREDTQRRIARLEDAIGERVAAREEETGQRSVSGEQVVEEAKWLLRQMTTASYSRRCFNCTDPQFRANMPPHLREMIGIIERIDPEVSPEELIAAMFHDADRLYEGNYVRVADEPLQGSEAYTNYYKPIQHPRMAAEFIVPLLRQLGIDGRIVKRVDILIRHHESGISDARTRELVAEGVYSETSMIPGRLQSASRVIMDADSISALTPEFIINDLRDKRQRSVERDFFNEVHQKYTRCSPRARRVIDQLMEERRQTFEATEEGRHVLRTFARVQRQTAVMLVEVSGATIAHGYDADELAEREARIRQRSDTVRDNNEDIVAAAALRCGEITGWLTEKWYPAGLEQAGVITEKEKAALGDPRFVNALKGYRNAFNWGNATVEHAERYHLGSKHSLMVNLMRYLLHREEATDQRDLLLEYILHEALEKTDLTNNEIITLTTKLLHPKEAELIAALERAEAFPEANVRGQTALGKEARLFINKDYVASRIACLNGERKADVWQRLEGMSQQEIDHLRFQAQEAHRISFNTKRTPPPLYTPDEATYRDQFNASGKVLHWPFLRTVAQKIAKAEPEPVTREEVNRLIEFRCYDSAYVRGRALLVLEEIAKKQPDLITPGEMERRRLEFRNDDVKQDMKIIMSGITDAATYDAYVRPVIQEIYGEEVNHGDLKTAEVEHIGGEGLKGVYKITFTDNRGRRFTVAMPIIKDMPPLAGKEPEYVVNLKAGLGVSDMDADTIGINQLDAQWRQMAGLRDKLVPYFGGVTLAQTTSLSIQKEAGKEVYGDIPRDAAVICCEFVEGPTLQEILDSDEYTDEEKERYRADAMRTTARMWAYRGTFQGDPKPSNLMFSKRDQAFLMTNLDIIRRGDLANLVTTMVDVGYGDANGIVRFTPGTRPVEKQAVPVETPSMLLSDVPAVIDIVRNFGTINMPLGVFGVHPDDIEDGSTALQRELLRLGNNNIHWGVLTSGADPTGVSDESIAGYGSLPVDELTRRKGQLRQAETIESARTMGVALENVTFFGFGDGSRDVEGLQAEMGPAQEEEIIEYLKTFAQGLPDGAPIAIAWNIAEDAHAAHVHGAHLMDSAVARFVEITCRPVYMVHFRQFNGDPAAEHPNLYVCMSQSEAAAKYGKVLPNHQSQVVRRRMQTKDGKPRIEVDGSLLDESETKDDINVDFAVGEFPDEFSRDDYPRAERFQVTRRDPVITSPAGRANIKFMDDTKGSLGGFFREVRTIGQPRLLRVTVEDLQEMELEERRNWLVTLNEEPNVFIELCSEKDGYKAAADSAYTDLGLAELLEKKEKMPDGLRPDNRNMTNTITLILGRSGMKKRDIHNLIQMNPALQDPTDPRLPNSILVPVAGVKAGDSMGLVRGSTFAFQLLRIARDPENKQLIEEARVMYNDLMHDLGLADFDITAAEIVALVSGDPNKLVSALEKLIAALPTKVVEPQERLELYRQAQMYLRAA